MSEEKDKNTVDLSTSDCPITSVTVYKDRAEISRIVKTTLKTGVNEVKITGLVDLDEDSIRYLFHYHVSIVLYSAL